MNKKELFIVEGKSACSALRLATDNKSQSVHALQGKLANVGKMSHEAIVANLECQKLLTQLGGKFDAEYKASDLPFSQVFVLMDPDIDGSHSSALVLSFFARYCKSIVASGLLSIIKPPMFRVVAQACEPAYAWSEEELQQILAASNNGGITQTTRFKGIAQFTVEECHQLLLHPTSRRQYTLSLE